jgi:hypothetical protein
LQVKVLDVLGFAKAGAQVRLVGTGAGPASATTDADGNAVLQVTPDTDQLLEVSLPGHTNQFKPVRVALGQSAFFQAKLMARAPALTLADAAAGGTLVGRNAARVTLPPGGLVDAQTGAAVTGAVQVEMTPVNTASHEISAFPGSMRGLSGTTEGLLATYGPVEYIFTQAGRKLNLATGQSAVIEMPLHAKLNVDGTPLEVGDTMPVWSLNETTGVWLQEGEGTVVASASATGLALRATVTHFSWFNPDYFSNPRRLNISFIFPEGITPTVCCAVEAMTTPGFPGPAGLASITLPPTGGQVIVDSASVYLITARGLSAAGALFGGRDVSVPLGTEPLNVVVTLRLDPNAPNPVITSPAAGVTTYTRGTVNVQASVSGGEPDLVQLLGDAFLLGAMTGSQTSGYSIDFDTTPVPEDSYEITVRAARGTTAVVSAPRTVIVDRTPPLLTGRSPAPGAGNVGTLDVIKATFNEVLDPASLVNDQDPTVLLSVGSSPGGAPIAVVLTLSPDGRTVTATPATPLLFGTQYTVVVQGLTDRAGNPMAQALWSVSVPLSAISSPDLRFPGAAGRINGNAQGRPEIALASNGQPLVAWRQDVDNVPTIQAARLIGNLWVPLPALLPTAPTTDLSMDLDPTGQPVVAWTQNTTNIGSCTGSVFRSQLFVARFNGSGWQMLGDGELNIEPCSGPHLPRLKVDLAGRPVLVSAQAGTFNQTMQVRRFQGAEWTLLGTVPVRSVPAASIRVLELRLALDGNLPLVLASENASGTIRHFVSRLDGNAFAPAGGQVAVGNRDVRAALVLDPQGRAFAAVQTTGNALRLLQLLDSGNWAPVGSALVTNNPFPNFPSIVFDGNQPIVGWHDGGVNDALLRRFDPFAGDWAETRTIRTGVGTLSELRRMPTGGPIWGALTTGPSNSELRTVTAAVLP